MPVSLLQGNHWIVDSAVNQPGLNGGRCCECDLDRGASQNLWTRVTVPLLNMSWREVNTCKSTVTTHELQRLKIENTLLLAQWTLFRSFLENNLCTIFLVLDRQVPYASIASQTALRSSRNLCRVHAVCKKWLVIHRKYAWLGKGDKRINKSCPRKSFRLDDWKLNG